MATPSIYREHRGVRTRVWPGGDASVLCITDVAGARPFFESICERIASRSLTVGLLEIKELLPSGVRDCADPDDVHRDLTSRAPDELTLTVLTQALELGRDQRSTRIAGFSLGGTLAWLAGSSPDIDRVAAVSASRIRMILDRPPPVHALLPMDGRTFLSRSRGEDCSKSGLVA